MAQNYVGSNNMNLLVPSGQFGTRLQGGKDSASPRYIFTKLSKITRYLFKKQDDDILDYQNDDGQSIEPKFYIPILPLVLINGAEGIGTAWSTNIPNHNPLDVVDNLKRLLNGEEMIEMAPWYKNFDGNVQQSTGDSSWATCGSCEQVNDDSFEITELPVKVWTQTYKDFLEKLIGEDSNQIKDFRENHTDITVSFTVKVTPEQMKHIQGVGIEKYFKLTKKISLSNMTLFASDGRIKTFGNSLDVIHEFYEIRMQAYLKRKEFMMNKYKRELNVLDNKVRFILMVCKDELIIRKRKKQDLLQELKKLKFDLVMNQKSSASKSSKKKKDDDREDDDDDDQDDGNSDRDESESESESESNTKQLENGYSYLLNMSLMSLTFEKVQKLESEKQSKQDELDALIKRDVKDIWLQELDEFCDALEESEQKDIKDEEDYLKKIVKEKKKKAGKIAVSKGLRRTSRLRPAAIIKQTAAKGKRKKEEDDDELPDEIDEEQLDENGEPIKKKKAPAKKTTAAKKTATKKETAASKSKQTKLSFKKKKEEEEDEEDVKSESEEDKVQVDEEEEEEEKVLPTKKKPPVVKTKAVKSNKKTQVQRVEDSEDEKVEEEEEDDDDMGDSLAARLAKKNSIPSPVVDDHVKITSPSSPVKSTTLVKKPVAKKRKITPLDEAGSPKITSFFKKATTPPSKLPLQNPFDQVDLTDDEEKPKVPEKKAPAKKPVAKSSRAKKKEESEDEAEEDESDVELIGLSDSEKEDEDVQVRARPTRGKKPTSKAKVVVEEEDDEDDEEEEDEEEEITVDDEESDYEPDD
ncbi:top2 [Acrasis kona]|uniref:DNA topoisomerase (ATP-hydrolyzing) n=1 Tax=Acrasis kona TaxID=1008807 RepID=A0AAW2ZMG1_9EUKA